MQKWNACLLTFHILNVYVDKTQPRQFKFTFKTNVQVVHKATVGAYIKVKFVFFNRFNRCICCEETVIEITLN